MNLAATITLNSQSFVKGIGSAVGAVNSFVGGSIGKIASPMAVAIGGMLSVGSAALALKSSISKAADMEDLEMSFVTLLGSTQAAKERLAELSKFAAETPFELQGIGRASKVLQSLTEGALATGDGLKMVGDMAAMSGQPIAELSVTVGRLYNGLQSGKAAGEAIARLSELGLLSSSTREKLEKLQSSGQKGAKVWEVAATDFSKYSGEMQRKSQGWNGLVSTLKDNISLAMAEFGKPILDALKPFLKDAISMTESLFSLARNFGENVANAISLFAAVWGSGEISGIIADAFTFGFGVGLNYLLGGLKSVVELLGVGIESAFSLIMQSDFWSGLGNIIIGTLTGLGAFLIEIFTTPISYVQAGLEKVMQELLEFASSTKVGRKIFGVDENFVAETFDDILSKTKAQNKNKSSEALDVSAAYLSKGSDKLKSPLEGAFKDFESVFSNFSPSELIKNSEALDRLKLTMGKLQESVNNQKSAVERQTEVAKKSADTVVEKSGTGIKLRDNSDRLSRIGGYVGGSGGVLQDYNRKIADNTLKIAKGIDEINNRRTNITFGSATWA